jgi:argininosuccinate synthase
MQSLTIIDSLEDLESRNIKSCVLLYSGGIDGSYFLDWANDHGIEVVCLNIGLNHCIDRELSTYIPDTLGMPHVFQHRTEEFLNDYVSLGIMSNAFYQGLYPICSSLSRPLMAKAAVYLAHELKIQAIVHTSTYMQNSAARFNLSILALDPEIRIIAPFLRSQITREQKMKRLREKGFSFQNSIYSVDQNIWGRVIECGSLENPENDIPESGVFTWTSDIDQAPNDKELIEIEFMCGLPISLNQKKGELIDIVHELNVIGGRHGIGRFSGLEDISFGPKNHEVREAPAAQILIGAHRDLESAILSQSELSLKMFLDNHWINLIVSGLWYSEFREAITAFSTCINKLINGKVRIKLQKGNMIIISRETLNGLYYAAFKEEFSSVMQSFSFSPTYTTMGLPFLRRRSRF